MSEREDLQEVLDKLGWSYKVPEQREGIRELLAQPEQEPVAWMWKKHTAGGWLNTVGLDKPIATAHQINIYPLYLAPPTREPLSDEEIVKLWANKSPMNEFECVRLIEKAHGIGVDDE